MASCLLPRTLLATPPYTWSPSRTTHAVTPQNLKNCQRNLTRSLNVSTWPRYWPDPKLFESPWGLFCVTDVAFTCQDTVTSPLVLSSTIVLVAEPLSSVCYSVLMLLLISVYSTSVDPLRLFNKLCPAVHTRLKPHCVFTLQVIDVLIGTDEHGRRVPKYLIHFNGWNRRYHNSGSYHSIACPNVSYSLRFLLQNHFINLLV